MTPLRMSGSSEVFWGPMAYTVIGGLFVATLLTLLFLPALYVAWFRIKEPRKEPEQRLEAGVPAAEWSTTQHGGQRLIQPSASSGPMRNSGCY